MKRLFALTLCLSAALVLAPSSARSEDSKPNPPATGPSTKPTSKPSPAPVVEVQPDGSLLLKAEGARIHGFKLHLDTTAEPALVYWIDSNEYPEWPQAVKKGNYVVEVTYSCPPKAGGSFSVSAAANSVSGKTESTGDWQTFKTVKLGTLFVLNDNTSIAVHVSSKLKHAVMNVRSIKLTPTDEPAKPTKKK